MVKFNSVDEILVFAIREEEKAAAFYQALAGRVKRPGLRRGLEEFAEEELGHKAKLEKVRREGTLAMSGKAVLDLKIGEYLVAPDPSPDMDYQEVLIVAMKKEKEAFRMYTDLAGVTEDAGIRAVFLSLAQEEARHKLRFEVEYDEHFLTEN